MFIIQKPSYLETIKKIIAKKTFNSFKRALREGQREAKELSQPFADFLKNSTKRLHQAKIDQVALRAQYLIEEALEKEPTLIIPMVLKLLKNIAEHTDVELTAHPKDARTIKESQNEITTACISARKIIIVEDENFKRGSLVIKANKSVIDAQIATQIAKAKELLTERQG